MILLLAGTMEARNLAGHLAEAGLDCVASLAGVTAQPRGYAVETRVGGFGGAVGFADYLDTAGITSVIDATHPFAARMTATAAQVCATKGLPYLRYERAVWRSRPGDAWHEAANVAALSDIIPAKARVFLATGKNTVADYGHLDHAFMWARVVDPQPTPFPHANGEFIVARPPFSEADERALFARLKPDWLVVKNAGGATGRAKLDAARELGISVAMLARPCAPEGIERREQLLDALEWAEVHP